MNQPLHYSTMLCSLLLGWLLIHPGTPSQRFENLPKSRSQTNSPKIQAAILLDVSNSMDGLIEQAKNQLWNMVSVMGKVKCADGKPQIEIALYEYGRIENGVADGYVKQIAGFTSDLELLSKKLYELTTHGGEEYCGHVLYSSLDQLGWDSLSGNYKVIFIAGNEDFFQGDVPYSKACALAKKKSVIINTIYCGSQQKGVEEHWNLGNGCGIGSFMNIDQEAQPAPIRTPYDDELITLNRSLTATHVYYGSRGALQYEALHQRDTVPVTDSNDPSKIIKYRLVRADARFYDDSGWDLVAESEKDKNAVEKVDKKTLPDSLKNKSTAELQQIIAAKSEERRSIKKRIETLDKQRDDYILAERKKAGFNAAQTLGVAIEKIIRGQVTRFNMRID
jgi:hypothetical protein